MAELDLDWLKAQWRDSLKNWIESGLAEKRWRETANMPSHPGATTRELKNRALFHEKMRNRFAGEHSVICKVLMRYCTSENIPGILDWMQTTRNEVIEESREDANYIALDGGFNFGGFRY